MYPDLSYILHDIFGTARDNGFSIVKTFGLFLGITFIVMTYILYLEFKRKEQEGTLTSFSRMIEKGKGPDWVEVLLNGAIGFFLFFKIPYIIQNFDAFKDDAAGIVFSKLGILPFGLLGLIIFGGYSFWVGWRNKLPKPKLVKEITYPSQKVGDIIILAAVTGIIGSRVFSILENLDSFIDDPIGQIFSGSGLTVYGGLIFGTFAVAWYLRRLGVSIFHGADSIAPALMMGYATGRMGCQFSGDGDWGIVNEAAKPSWFIFPDWAWAYEYPHNVLNEGVRLVNCIGNHCNKLSPPVYPTPIYEIAFCLIAFAFMWSIRKKIKMPGTAFCIFLVLTGIERFFVEFIRINPTYDFGGVDLSQAQFIAVGMIIAGLGGYYYLRKKHSLV